MTVTNLRSTGAALSIAWSDGMTCDFPGIWLRDNCPSGFHPDTQERTADLLSLPGAPTIVEAQASGEVVTLGWADTHESRFSLDWLRENAPGQRRADPADIAPLVWRAGIGVEGIKRHNAGLIATDSAHLAAWMQDTAAYGLTIVEGVAAAPGAGIALAEKIGFLRRTNFGTTFDVINKPDPNNLAYTAEALPLHTDLPNQEVPPGYQFLNCIANEATGGGSVFADGFAIADALRVQDPTAYRLLADTPIPFRFHDASYDIAIKRPVISENADGSLSEIRWNAHIAGVFDMPADQLVPYYRAYRAYMALTRDPAFALSLKLGAGEMVVFDNRRILHGREAFDPQSGARHLEGCYVDRGEFASALRGLAHSRA